MEIRSNLQSYASTLQQSSHVATNTSSSTVAPESTVVTLSSDALALLEADSAGGGTLPPWPPKETEDVAVSTLSAGGGTLPPWPPKET